MKLVKIGLVLLVLLSLPYYKTEIFDFEKGVPFKGDVFYNPYNGISTTWLKANFHAHSKLHWGLANGEDTPEEMYQRYDSIHYDMPLISNYNSILPDIYNRELYIPAYEHGMNFGTIHQLVLNSKGVENYDFMFYQSKSHKQSVINKQKLAGDILILAHPSFKNGYSKKDLHVLNNYDLFEGVSPRASSIALWDEALTHGHAVWATGSDDAHEKGLNFTGVCWTMVNVNDSSEQAILKALKKGAFYATRGWQGQEMFRIKKVSVDTGVYHLQLDSRVDSLIVKSDFGKTVATAFQTDRISYVIQDENSYVRAEAFKTEPWNSYTKSYINPVVRTVNGKLIKHNSTATVNSLLTGLFRVILLLVHLSLLIFVFKRRKI
jgi:hypothetical protein